MNSNFIVYQHFFHIYTCQLKWVMRNPQNDERGPENLEK